MSLANWVRLGGVAAAFGGAVFGVINAIYLLLFALPASNWAARATIGFALDLFGVLVAVLFFVALAGLYALLGRRSGLGLFGPLLAGASAVASASYVVFSIAYVAYKAFLSPDQTGPPPNLIFPEVTFDRVEDAFLAGGLLLLGAAVVRARALRAWSILPVVLCAMTLLSFLLQTLFGPAGWGWAAFLALVALQGSGWILLGAVLWMRAADHEAGSASAGLRAHGGSAGPA